MSNLTPIRSVEGITEYKLENGLSVLCFPDSSQSTVTVNITYLVGSRHEGRGEAGMAHLLEHMLFKGTPTYKNTKGELQDRGAFFNATTWFDRTNYFETLPASDDNLRFALRFEADRMVNSFVAEEDLRSEMTVVRNEFEMGENSPFGVLHDQMLSAAFRWHNYGKTTIGNRSDIERVPAKALRKFYEHYYQPDNAVLIIAGKFDEQTALNWTEEFFGILPKPTRVLDVTYTEEPAQDGPREVVLRRTGDVSFVGACYHTPAGSHPDFPAVSILADLLSDEPSGTLYKELVETHQASEISGMSYALAEPAMLMFFARPSAVDDAQKILDRLTELVESFGQKAPLEEEVSRAKSRALKGIKLTLANSTKLAFRLSETIAQGDYRLFFWYRDAVKNVTAADVQRVAKAYLMESNRTSGMFIPTVNAMRAHVPPTPIVEELLRNYSGAESTQAGEAFVASLENLESRTTRVTIQEGMKAAFLPKQTRGDLVRAQFIFRFGTEEALTGKKAALSLLPQLLTRGTAQRNYQELQDHLDELQSVLNIYGNSGVLMADITSDRTNMPGVLKLLAEIAKTPSLDQAEFNVIKKKDLADLEELKSDPQRLGMNFLDRQKSPWPKTSIHYVATIEEKIERLAAVDLGTIQEIYHNFYGASRLEFAMVGAFDQHQMADTVLSLFGKWPSKSPFKRITRPFLELREAKETIKTPDKQMALVAEASNFQMRDTDTDYPAMDFANYILGESMKSRLAERLREKEGLSYSARSMLDVGRHERNASLTLYAICAPNNADRAQQCIAEEYARWVDSGATQQELAEGKPSFKSTLDNYLANDAFVVDFLAHALEINRDFSYYKGLLSAVDALTQDDIRKVLHQYLAKAQVATVKAGDF